MVKINATLSGDETLAASLSESSTRVAADLDTVTLLDTGVSSWNGQRGDVTYTPPVTSVNGHTGAVIVEVPSLDGYATQTWVESQGYLTEHQSLSEYAKLTDLPVVPVNVSAFNNDAGYLIAHQSLSGYATEAWVTGKGYLTSHQSLVGYATESWVNAKGYLTSHQSLDNYYTKSDIDATIGVIEGLLAEV